MYKILVTGGAGYIGSTLVPLLLNEGHKVTVVDNFLYKQCSLNHVCNNPHFNVIKGDIRVRKVIEPLVSEADIIIPLAALVGAPLCSFDPIGATTTNYDSIVMMLDMVSKNQKIIMPTTNSAYGTGDINNFCTEESQLSPISQYALEKVEIEKKIMQHKNSVSFRLATVFGMSPRMRIDLLVNDFTYRAVNDKFIVLFESHFKRNYIHVIDVARVFIHAINNWDLISNNVYNVGLSNSNISKRELCEIIKEILPEFIFTDAVIGKDPDQRNYIVSNAKLENTGYKTSKTLHDGVVELIKGFQMIKNTEYSNI